MKSVRSTGAGTVRHSSNISYAAGIFAVIIISSAISFSIYFHRLVKPTYFDFGYINNSSNSHSEYQNHSSTNYLPKTTTLVDFAGSILDAFSRNSPEEKAYCDNSTSIWCSIPIPAESHFRFPEPPNDLNRWKIAQGQAATGEQVLLKKILETFPFFMDFLDGDIQFRLLHNLADIFVDGFGKNDLSPLV
eukprot:gene13320-17692_t